MKRADISGRQQFTLLRLNAQLRCLRYRKDTEPQTERSKLFHQNLNTFLLGSHFSSPKQAKVSTED